MFIFRNIQSYLSNLLIVIMSINWQWLFVWSLPYYLDTGFFSGWVELETVSETGARYLWYKLKPDADLNNDAWEKKHLSYSVAFSTFSPLITTIVQCANILDADEMPSNLASNPDPSCLTFKHLQQLCVT